MKGDTLCIQKGAAAFRLFSGQLAHLTGVSNDTLRHASCPI